MIFLKLMLIPMLIKVLLATRQPALCAFLYGACLFTNGLMFDLAFGGDWRAVAQSLALSTLAAFGFFWLLRELESSGAAYWATLVLGVALLAWL